MTDMGFLAAGKAIKNVNQQLETTNMSFLYAEIGTKGLHNALNCWFLAYR